MKNLVALALAVLFSMASVTFAQDQPSPSDAVQEAAKEVQSTVEPVENSQPVAQPVEIVQPATTVVGQPIEGQIINSVPFESGCCGSQIVQPIVTQPLVSQPIVSEPIVSQPCCGAAPAVSAPYVSDATSVVSDPVVVSEPAPATCCGGIESAPAPAPAATCCQPRQARQRVRIFQFTRRANCCN